MVRKPLATLLLSKGYTVKGSTTKECKLSDIDRLGVQPYLVDIEEYEEFDLFLQSDILVVAITSKTVAAYKRLIEQIQESNIQKVILSVLHRFIRIPILWLLKTTETVQKTTNCYRAMF